MRPSLSIIIHGFNSNILSETMRICIVTVMNMKFTKPLDKLRDACVSIRYWIKKIKGHCYTYWTGYNMIQENVEIFAMMMQLIYLLIASVVRSLLYMKKNFIKMPTKFLIKWNLKSQPLRPVCQQQFCIRCIVIVINQ